MGRMVALVSRVGEDAMRAVETITGISTTSALTVCGAMAIALTVVAPSLACEAGGRDGGGAAIREGNFTMPNFGAIHGLRCRTICCLTSLCVV